MNIGVHAIGQNEVSQLCRWLLFAVREDRGEAPPEAIAAVLLPGSAEAGNGLPCARDGGWNNAASSLV